MTLTIGRALSNTGSRDIGDIFNFRSNSHELIVLDFTVLDREAIDVYNFTVNARDIEGLTSSAQVTINIQDFNDETPVITNDGYVANSLFTVEPLNVDTRVSTWEFHCITLWFFLHVRFPILS